MNKPTEAQKRARTDNYSLFMISNWRRSLLNGQHQFTNQEGESVTKCLDAAERRIRQRYAK